MATSWRRRWMRHMTPPLKTPGQQGAATPSPPHPSVPVRLLSVRGTSAGCCWRGSPCSRYALMCTHPTRTHINHDVLQVDMANGARRDTRLECPAVKRRRVGPSRQEILVEMEAEDRDFIIVTRGQGALRDIFNK